MWDSWKKGASSVRAKRAMIAVDGGAAAACPRKHARCGRALVVALLATHGTLLGWGAWSHSPTVNEPSHLASGLSHLSAGRFDLYRVNPPLVRTWAAVWAACLCPKTDWSRYSTSPQDRREAAVALSFLKRNGFRSFRLVTAARLGCIPLSLLGGYVCFRWASEVHGRPAGLMALIIWSFSPNVIAHAQLITPDAGAAALGVAAAYAFWRWLKCPNWTWTLTAGLALGLAELTKTSWTVLFLLWPLLWAIWRYSNRRGLSPRTCSHEARQLAAILLLGLYVINLGYGFEGSFKRLGDYGFVSQTLGGPSDDTQSRIRPRNRFAGSWLSELPVPLPENYVMGIDLQKRDFERGFPSYLRGEWRTGGWWYYYLYALAIKVPLGTWMLALLAIGMGLSQRGYAGNWRDELVLLSPIFVMLTLVSSQTGFNHHLRYILPVFPLAFIWMSKVAKAFEFGHNRLAAVVVLAIAWSVGSSLWVYPHSLSYFNELVGGPKNGDAHVLDSNIDWGQDLLYLKCWLDEHGEAEPLHLAFYGLYDAGIAGIEYTRPPTEPRPGWHALSVNKIRSRSHEYEYFLRFEPVAMAGYSIYIYHVTLDEANRVRRELGMPELPAT